MAMQKCRWCGKSFNFSDCYKGYYCSRRCYEKAQAQNRAERDREKADWEATKQKIRDSGGCFSWLFKTILKIIKWTLIAIVAVVVIAILLENNGAA